MPERYITNSGSSDRNALADALQKIVELCASLSHNIVILHLPTKNNLRLLSLILGQDMIRNLKKDNYGRLNNIQFTLNTERLEISDSIEDIVLSIYPTSKMIDNINNLKRARAIVVVPWIDKVREEWINIWNPEIIGGEEVEIYAIEIEPKIERALTALTTVINMSTGLTHSSDRESAIQLLQILHKNGIQLNPEIMKTWALQNGWTSDGANQLKDIAQRILEGRRFRTSGINMWNEKFIQELLEN